MKTTEELIEDAMEELRQVKCESDNHYPLDALGQQHIKALESFLVKKLNQIALHAKEERDAEILELLPEEDELPADQWDDYSKGYNTCLGEVKALLSPKTNPND
ncbi:hypothetical protein KBA63_00140 [Candidatus Woesebacteria bacterium]|nr:hypothetical protein [Candidatus Woesebacteria bacterium]